MSAANASLGRLVVSLGLITVLAGALLALTDVVTTRPKAEAEAKMRRDAIAGVSPRFDNDPEADMRTVDGMTVYPLTLGGEPVGAAVETFSDSGFSDRITLMVGFDSDGRVTGYRVLSHSETPGLGAKMDTWFNGDKGSPRSVIGREAGSLNVTKDGGEVDAITGATITSRAFLEAINRAYTAIQ